MKMKKPVSEMFNDEYMDSREAMSEIMARKKHRQMLRLSAKEKQYAELSLKDDWAEAARSLYYSESGEDSQDFTTCQRPDGSKYGTSGQCRKGKEVSPEDLGVKAPKSGGGPLEKSITDEAKAKAKSEAFTWGDKEDKIFDNLYAKAENTAHLGKIHKAAIKAIDEGDLDAKEGTLKAMKKEMDGVLKTNMRSGAGAKRAKELEAMTPEERKRAAAADRIQRGIKNKVVSGRR
jgi:hypothetical protein